MLSSRWSVRCKSALTPLAGALTLTFFLAAPAQAADPQPAATAAASVTPPPGRPLLPVAPLMDAQLQDLDDRPVSLRAMRGKVVVLLHQDRHSSEQNPDFKDHIGDLVLRYKDQIQLVALASVGGFNFWPAKGYVKDALKPLRELGGSLVACDWKGALRKVYGIPEKQSAVFVIGKNGELVALQRGVFSPAQADALLNQIEQLAGS